MNGNRVVIGLDFGTDSVRALIVDATTGQEVSSAVSSYKRWSTGKYCRPELNQFRQHPLDYLESMEECIRGALEKAPTGTSSLVVGISVDTTGSTPVVVDRQGTPLSLRPGFEENPNAMFMLWKDHTAVEEAAEINALCASWDIDYSRYAGGVYSSEWFWAKILHILREDPSVRTQAYSWVEHCDWIPHVLTGGSDVHMIKRSRCAAGHKALWHESFGGLPPNNFFTALDPLLDGLDQRMFQDTYTADVVAGNLSEEWAKRLGLNREVVVSVGAFDAHMGAVGGQIAPYHLSKIMGTSTCDIMVAPLENFQGKTVPGICGQVDGSVIPGMLGLEAGQSAFGDIYAWYKSVLAFPVLEILNQTTLIDAASRQALVEEILEKIIPSLSEAAEKIPPSESGVLALDWLNGRRTPDANQALKGALMNLQLGSDAPRIFRALVEASCYGARKIVERFQEEGVPIEGIIGLGGVAKKSPFVMQVLADVLNRPIKIARSEQTCALGAAMFAAVAAGVHKDIPTAMQAMGAGFDTVYEPRAEYAEIYDTCYAAYIRLGKVIESITL